MGIFSSVFGGTGKYDAQNRAAMGYSDDMFAARESAANAYNRIIADLARERNTAFNQYSQLHRDARKSWERQVDASRARLSAGLDESYNLLAAGREDTLALVRQATEDAMASRQVQNAFTGLSQTSWGQGSLDAIGMQGALQQGAIVEQYAQTLASAKSMNTQALAAWDSGVAQTSLGLGMDKANTALGQANRFASAISGVGMQAAAVDTDLAQQYALNRFNARWQATNNNSIGNAFGKSLVGAGIGALGALVGGPAGAMIGSQIGAAATSDTGQGGWGGGGGQSSGGGGMGSMLGMFGSIFGGG